MSERERCTRILPSGSRCPRGAMLGQERCSIHTPPAWAEGAAAAELAKDALDELLRLTKAIAAHFNPRDPFAGRTVAEAALEIRQSLTPDQLREFMAHLLGDPHVSMDCGQPDPNWLEAYGAARCSKGHVYLPQKQERCIMCAAAEVLKASGIPIGDTPAMVEYLREHLNGGQA